MSRLLLLLVFILWLGYAAAYPVPHAVNWTGPMLFLSGYALVVLSVRFWSRSLAARVVIGDFARSMVWFNRIMQAVRYFVPAWFAAGLFLLDWGDWVMWNLPWLSRWPVELPGVIVGTLPAFAAWTALIWAQHPTDRAMREQAMLHLLEQDLPLRPGPSLKTYFLAHLRMQVLFTLVPVMCILLLRDLLVLILHGTFPHALPTRGSGAGEMIELGITLLAAGGVFLIAPEILRRILHTQRLPTSELRDRLERMCRRLGLRYRDILLWRTDHTMGNAAVMGIVPRWRYILLSDLLLETMTDRQIEAVFAHEVGHIVHRHMVWYIVLILILMLALLGPIQFLESQAVRWLTLPWFPVDLVLSVLSLIAFFAIFGAISRKFERQADVYAARTIQQQLDAERAMTQGMESAPTPTESYVGQHGAGVFASALHRVATINNIPISARNFSHGSIDQRMRYLQSLSTDPSGTGRFDRTMTLLYTILLVLLAGSGLWAGLSLAG